MRRYLFFFFPLFSTASNDFNRFLIPSGLEIFDASIWEQEPLKKLAADGQLMAYEHQGFWQPMDTLRDKTYLEELWATGNAPWKVWS